MTVQCKCKSLITIKGFILIFAMATFEAPYVWVILLSPLLLSCTLGLLFYSYFPLFRFVPHPLPTSDPTKKLCIVPHNEVCFFHMLMPLPTVQCTAQGKKQSCSDTQGCALTHASTYRCMQTYSTCAFKYIYSESKLTVAEWVAICRHDELPRSTEKNVKKERKSF